MNGGRRRAGGPCTDVATRHAAWPRTAPTPAAGPGAIPAPRLLFVFTAVDMPWRSPILRELPTACTCHPTRRYLPARLHAPPACHPYPTYPPPSILLNCHRVVPYIYHPQVTQPVQTTTTTKTTPDAWLPPFTRTFARSITVDVSRRGTGRGCWCAVSILVLPTRRHIDRFWNHFIGNAPPFTVRACVTWPDTSAP